MPDDPLILGLSRLAYQFSDSSKFKGFLESFLAEYQELQVSELQLLNERYLDSAEGAQLDGIGEIVGLERFSFLDDVVGAFGFLSDPTSVGFGSLSDPILGGNFVSLTRDSTEISDDSYRTAIRGKIIVNQTNMVVDDTIRLVSFMFGNVKVRYFLPENLKPVYAIEKLLTSEEYKILEEVPILIGLGEVSYYVTFDTDAFSFFEDPDGLGFGDLGDSTLGGNFATFI